MVKNASTISDTPVQDELFHWFVEHNVDLYKQYGKGIYLIKDKVVCQVFQDIVEAVSVADRIFGDEPHIIQECDGTPDSYTAYVYGVFSAQEKAVLS